jgi:hypothetical protein
MRILKVIKLEEILDEQDITSEVRTAVFSAINNYGFESGVAGLYSDSIQKFTLDSFQDSGYVFVPFTARGISEDVRIKYRGKHDIIKLYMNG